MGRNAEQVLVYNNFMKNDVLRGLTMEAYAGSNADTLNIYIDIYRMIMDLYEPKLEVKVMSIIVSSVVNLCAHLRSYYWTRHRVNTNIFLVYSDMSNPYNKSYCPGYNSTNDLRVTSNQRITEFISYNISLLKILCPYLPDIYFVEGVYEPSVIILDLIYKEEASGNLFPNLVFTRDDIALQLAGSHNNTTIFLDSKRTGVSMYANYTNAISVYMAKSGRKKLIESPAVISRINGISSHLLGAIIALTNLPSRSVKAIYDANKAINIVSSAIARNTILNGPASDPRVLYDGLFVGSEAKFSKDSFAFRYNAVDLLTMHRMYIYTPYAKDISYKVNLDDSNAVKAINNEYFRDNPLDLNRL